MVKQISKAKRLGSGFVARLVHLSVLASLHRVFLWQEAMSGRFAAENLYDQIIHQVVEDARVAFTDEGMDTNVLSELAKVRKMTYLYICSTKPP